MASPVVHSRLPGVYTLMTVCVLLAAALWTPSAAQAQGFGLFEQGTCAMGRAVATVAQSCDDGSAIYFNPAGIAGTEGATASAGATVVWAQGDFTFDRTGNTVDLQNDAIPVPHLYTTYGIDERWAVGLGVYVPYGLSTEWPRTFDGAFLGFNNSIQTIYIQPTVALNVTDRIKVGVGPIVTIGSVELNQVIDLSEQELSEGVTFGQIGVPFHTAFAATQLEATNAVGFGGNFGVEVQATDRLNIGVRFTTPIEMNYDGEATFDQIETGLVLPVLPGTPLTDVPVDRLVETSFTEGPLVTQDIETTITMPAQFVAGISVQATEQLLLLFDYQWVGWSSFDEITLDFETLDDQVQVENYDNTSGFRFGADYQLTDQWAVRGGYIYTQNAAPDETVTPLLPESDRNQFTLGVGWRATEYLELNAAYLYLGQNDRRGRTVEFEEGESLESVNNGLYSFSAHLVGLTATLRF